MIHTLSRHIRFFEPTSTVWIFLFVFFIANLGHAQSITINEINYRSDTVTQDIEFIELYNPDAFPIDISGGYVAGINYIIPANTVIPANKFLVIAQNPSDLQSRFNIPSTATVIGPYTGKLSNAGEEITIYDSNFIELEKMEYGTWGEWASVAYNDFKYRTFDGDYNELIETKKVPTSLQKIDPALPSKYPGSWEAFEPTPGRHNLNYPRYLVSNMPILNRVSSSPEGIVPPNTDVVIEIEFENHLNSVGLTPMLEYQIVSPGNYIKKNSDEYQVNWMSITMSDDGTGMDNDPNDGVFTAVIPASMHTHRTLIRYRILAQDLYGFFQYFPDQNHRESNYAYYVYDTPANVNGHDLNALSPLQDIQLLTTETEVNDHILSGASNEYDGEGTLIYQGEVYDHIGFRARGKGSRHRRAKRNVKFDFNPGRDVTVYNDDGEAYDVSRGKLSLSGTWVNDANSHGLTESIIYKIAELTGGFNKYADYCQLRIVDNALEADVDGDFWGVYLILEDWGSDMLEEHGLPDGNIYTYKGFQLSNEGKNGPYGADNQAYTIWNTGLGDSKDGCGTCATPTQPAEFYETHLDMDKYLANWITNEITGTGETSYTGQHSYREYYNPITQKWIVQCGDYDENFGVPHGAKTVSKRLYSNDNISIRGPLKNQLLSHNSTDLKFDNQIRHVIDLLLYPDQIDYMIDQEVKTIYQAGQTTNWTDIDYSRWRNAYDAWGETMDYNDYQIEVINWYKGWFERRKEVLIITYEDYDIPNQPTINYDGLAGYPLDGLSFACSDYAATNAFAAMEWRIGEWSDPSNPIYATSKAIYEITPIWESGEITTFANTITLPEVGLQKDHTYRARVRFKDTAGKWSRWSDPYQFIPSAAQAPKQPKLVINEIHYNSTRECGSDFVEITNADTLAIDLTNFAFTDGIEYKFPANTTLNPNEFLVLAGDSLQFELSYGFAPFGEYGGSLNNDGERLEIQGNYQAIIDSLTYNDSTPWDEMPDGNGPSLELLNVDADNTLPASWFRSDNHCGTPGVQNSRICISAVDEIIINEINYNSDNGNFDPGDWVELHNPFSYDIDLSNWEFYDDDSIFILPIGTTLKANDFLILTESVSQFKTKFTHLPDEKLVGDFIFNLNSKGERISIFDSNKCLADYVAYDDKMPWDTLPDGNGPTLSLTDPDLNNLLPSSWEASSYHDAPEGTPGRANIPCPEIQIEAPLYACVGVPTPVTVSSIYNNMEYIWLSNAATYTTPDSTHDLITWNTTGTFNIQLYTSYAECAKLVSKQIIVQECNNAPSIMRDNFNGDEDNLLVGNILINDGDPDSDSLIVNTSPITSCTNGNLIINPDGSFDYLPNANYYGADSFIYEVCDDATFTPLQTFARTINTSIQAGKDDAEEAKTGIVYDGSSDLELVTDVSGEQTIGLIFRDLNIPQGATISNAFIQFSVDESPTDSTSLTICAERAGHATDFTNANFNISSIDRTNTSINWSDIPLWTSGTTESSPNIGTIVQEIINQNDWTAGNALKFIIEGTGKRVVSSFEGGNPPNLVINYTYTAPSAITYNTSKCDTAIVALKINPINDIPTLSPDTLYTFKNDTLRTNVLNNDSDIENDILTASTIYAVSPINSSINILANGNIEYIPPTDYTGTEEFTYEVCDNGIPTACSTSQIVIIVEDNPCIEIQLFAWLEGPYNNNNYNMNNTLNAGRKLLPGQIPIGGNTATPTPAGQPYSGSPWNYTGTEGSGWSDADYPDTVVDWVLVSFRTGIESNTQIAKTAALIHNNGQITFPDRCALNGNIPNDLYIVLEHRNHIGIMTEMPVQVTNSTLTFDFRLADSYTGSTGFGQKLLPNGEWALYAGDLDPTDLPSYDITGSDKAVWTQNNGVFDVYTNADANMDGDINGADKNVWNDNNGISSRVPK